MQAHLNICEAPYHADPSGKIDCTDAICRAIDDITRATLLSFRQTTHEIQDLPPGDKVYHADGFENRRVNGKVVGIFCAKLPYHPTLFFPAGTYRISDTLTYSHLDLKNSSGGELNWQIRIRGEGPQKTFIVLDDHAKGFDDNEPKPLISVMRGEKTNVAMSNYVEDLCLNIGSGNSSAVGVDFFANNSGAVRNLEIISPDGQGFAGIQLGHKNYSGILIKHITVRGFDYGLHVDSGTGTMFAHAEDLKLSDQKIASIYSGAISLSLRNVNTKNVPTGLICGHAAGLTTLVDSDLSGLGPCAINHTAGSLYVSLVTTSGFQHHVLSSGNSVPSEQLKLSKNGIEELVLPKAFGETNITKGMDRLHIEETPIFTPLSEGEKSVGIRAFGAIGNGVNDDSFAFQRAIDSGAAEILVEPGRYLINQSITLPATLRRLCFNFCDLVAGYDLKNSPKKGGFIISEDSQEPLFIEDLFAWEQWSGQHCTFDHASLRTVCLSDLHTQTLMIYRNTVRGGKVFFDNVASTTGVIPGTPNHQRCCVELHGQKAFARQLNPERGEPMILNDNGELVLMGFKSEDMGAAVHTIHGGRTEVMGGVLNCGRIPAVAFLCEDSAMRISTVSQGWSKDGYYGTAAKQIVNGTCTVLKAEDLPLRGFEESRGPQYSVPLFVSKDIDEKGLLAKF